MPARQDGFVHQVRASGDVEIRHHGRPATTLRGDAAARFLAQLDDGADAQQLMARVTGNHARGERAHRPPAPAQPPLNRLPAPKSVLLHQISCGGTDFDQPP